jgi:predicted dehydrogenase
VLRIGILGASKIAPQAIIDPAFRIEGAEVLAVAASRPGAASAYAAQHGIPAAYADYAALLADPNVDLVYNALAVRDHVPFSIAALEAGKHVLCEKPIAMNAAEAASLVEASRRTGRRAIEAFHYRYHPLFVELEKMRNEQVLGTIRTLASEISDVREFAPQSVLHDPRLGGGTLMQAGCYAVNWMRALTGGEPRVESASAEWNPLGADSSIDAVFTFAGGERATLAATMASGRSIPPGNRLTIGGDRGSVTIENLIVPQFGHSVRIRMRDEPERALTVAGGASYDYQLAAVVSAIESGEPLPSEGADLILGMSVIDAVYRAAGRSIP